MMDFTQINLIPATLNDCPVIQNLARFYAYDISEYYGDQPGWEMEDDGLYGAGIDYKRYFETKDSFPFIIRYKDKLAGFAIIDKKGSDTTIDFNMAQFFILRTYKGRGMGRYVARWCFDKFPGIWEVMVMPGNEGAYRFWRKVIKEYCGSNFTECTRYVAQFNNEPRNFFQFSSL